MILGQISVGDGFGLLFGLWGRLLSGAFAGRGLGCQPSCHSLDEAAWANSAVMVRCSLQVLGGSPTTASAVSCALG